MNTEHSVRFCR